MDLNAAKLADGKASRLTWASLIICFVIASGMLLASLAMAHGRAPLHISASTTSLLPN